MIPAVDGAMLLVLVYLTFLTPSVVTNYDYNIRRGTTITSPAINVAQNDQGNIVLQKTVRMVMAIDSPGAVGPVQYSLSLHANGATGNTTINDAVIAVLSL